MQTKPIEVKGIFISKKRWEFVDSENDKKISGYSYVLLNPETHELYMFSISDTSGQAQIPDSYVAQLEPSCEVQLNLVIFNNGKSKFKFVSASELTTLIRAD